MSGLVLELCCGRLVQTRGLAQVEDCDLCSPQIPSETNSGLEMSPLLYKISAFVLKLMRRLTGEILSIHASICKVRHLTFVCLISLPSCTAEQLT